MLWSKLLVGSLLFSTTTCWSTTWQVQDGKAAHAVGLVASDGAPASIEVRCRPELAVRVMHPVLADMPTDQAGKLDWYQDALVFSGWGLELTRPDHYGHLGRWMRCAERPDCASPLPGELSSYVTLLRNQWSLFLRFDPPGENVVDLRVPLVGSAKAIDAVCP